MHDPSLILPANTAGHHLLTFANSHYQSRFPYNLYNTLIKALILGNEKIPLEEINNLLDMTAEFHVTCNREYQSSLIFLMNTSISTWGSINQSYWR